MTREFRLPDRTYLPATFERLGIDEQDQQALLAAWPSPAAEPEIWRSLERAYDTLSAVPSISLGVFNSIA